MAHMLEDALDSQKEKKHQPKQTQTYSLILSRQDLHFF